MEGLERLTAGAITISAGGRSVSAYRAQPEGKTQLPVMLVVSDISGGQEQIAEVARRFAGQGYLALAVFKAPEEQLLADLDAAVAWAKAHGGDGDNLAVTGFCGTGRIPWLYAARNPSVKAGVAWYGRLVGATLGALALGLRSKDQQKSKLDVKIAAQPAQQRARLQVAEA